MAKKYKIKTHKATAKRFRITGSGIVMRTKGGKTHFRRRRHRRNTTKLAEMFAVTNKAEAKKVRRLAPYLGRYRANPPG